MINDEVRMRPSKFGFTCYMATEGRFYMGHGTTMEAAYAAFIQYGSEALKEERGLSYFEARVFNANVRASHARLQARQEQAEAATATSNLPWWKRLFRV